MDRTENVDARTSLASWLRDGRNRKQLSIEDVARITKIQLRILERLENGQYEGLPADVFVKGFVRSVARCVGLDEAEAINRYGAAAQQPGVVVAQALAETLVPITQRKIDLFAPGPIESPSEPGVREAPLIEARPLPSIQAAPLDEAPLNKKKRSRRKGSNQPPRSRRKKHAAIELAAPIDASDAPPIDTASIETGARIDAESSATTVEAKTDPAIEMREVGDGAVDAPALAEGSQRISQASIEPHRPSAVLHAGSESRLAIDVALAPIADDDDASTTQFATVNHVDLDAGDGTWQPTMPPLSTTPSLPWRRPHVPKSTAYVVPSLIIDDADPDSADREREHRAAKEPHRLSFLPPILLDREDRSARQGGLTLAVIILLIAATLTLSYLMRRPSPRGDGVTMLAPTPTSTILG